MITHLTRLRRRAFGMFSALMLAASPALAEPPANAASANRAPQEKQEKRQEEQQNRQHDAPRALLAHLADVDALTGTFQQVRHIAVLAIPLHSSGQFRYQPERGIVWRTEEPIVNEIHITHDDGIVTVDDRGTARPLPASDVVAHIFLGLFSGELDRLRDYFSVDSNAGPPAQASHENTGHRPWELHLTPRLPALASQIDHIVVAGSAYVDTVIIQESNGDRSELSLALAPPVGNERQ